MYGVYDYDVVTHTHTHIHTYTHTHTRARAICDNLPREICDNLPQCPVPSAMSEKKFSPFNECSCFVYLRRQNKHKKMSVRPSVCLSVYVAVRTWTFDVDIISFKGVSGSKQNLVGVFYV